MCSCGLELGIMLTAMLAVSIGSEPLWQRAEMLTCVWLWQPEGGPGSADAQDSGKGRKRRQDSRCAEEAHPEGEEEALVWDVIVAIKKREETAHAERRVRGPPPLPRRWVHTPLPENLSRT